MFVKNISILYILLIINLLIAQHSFAQTKPDSIPIRINSWIILDDNTVKEIQIDTLFEFPHRYTPAQKYSYSNTFLGNIGNAFSPNILTKRWYDADIFGLALQNTPTEILYENYYHGYGLHAPTTQYFNTSKSFSQFNATINNNKPKEEITLKFFHTQNINPFWNIGLNYQLISSKGMFNNQKTRLSGVNFFTAYNKGRWSIYSSLANNKYAITHNGGISGDSLDTENQFLPVNLSKAAASMKNRTFHFRARYAFGNMLEIQPKILYDTLKIGEKDSLVKKITDDTLITRKFIPKNSITFRFDYTRAMRLYVDENPDSSFYGKIYRFSDKTHDSLSVRQWIPSLMWSFGENPNKKIPFLSWIRIGHEYTRHFQVKHFVYNNNDTATNSSFVGAGFNLKTKKKLETIGFAKYYFAGYKNKEMQIGAEMNKTVSFSKDSLVVGFRFQNMNLTPVYSLQRFSSNSFRWDNQFVKTNYTLLQSHVFIPRWKFDVGISQTTISNYIYFDSTATPRQHNKTISVPSVYVDKDLVLGKFHFFNRLTWQSISDSVLQMPKISYQLSVFYSGTFKNVMQFKIGTDMYYNSEFYVSGFMPATEQFYLSNHQLSGGRWLFDVFIDIALKKTLIFVKLENFHQFINTERYFLADNYPLHEFVIKAGLFWRFHD